MRGRPLEEVVTRLDAPFDEVTTWTWDTLWNGSLTESADPWGAVSYEYDTGTTFGQGGLTATERSWHTVADQPRGDTRSVESCYAASRSACSRSR